MKPIETNSSVIHLDKIENLAEHYRSNTSMIVPPFPNWDKSFVSGSQSTLFSIEHRIDKIDTHFLFSKVKFKDQCEGPPQHVHGGATAALIDELMGIVVWHNQYMGITQTLQLFYWRMVPISEEMIVVSQIQKVSPKKIEVRTTVFDAEKTPYVSATATFHRLTSELYEKFKNSRNLA